MHVLERLEQLIHDVLFVHLCVRVCVCVSVHHKLYVLFVHLRHIYSRERKRERETERERGREKEREKRVCERRYCLCTCAQHPLDKINTGIYLSICLSVCLSVCLYLYIWRALPSAAHMRTGSSNASSNANNTPLVLQCLYGSNSCAAYALPQQQLRCICAAVLQCLYGSTYAAQLLQQR